MAGPGGPLRASGSQPEPEPDLKDILPGEFVTGQQTFTLEQSCVSQMVGGGSG